MRVSGKTQTVHKKSTHGLKCLCLNAQSLRHKMSELLVTVEARKLDVIGITESWGDDGVSDSEFSIPGFSMFRVDRESGHRGGGVLLYVRSEMNAVETNIKSKFTDQVWCKVSIVNGEEILIGVCYRSPNIVLSGKDNENLLCDLIDEVQGKPLLLMGDFNYPDIDWSTACGQSPASQNFVDRIEDGFLTQHVREATRKGSILDLVITSEPEMIDAVSVLGRLGNSDHNILEWNVYLGPSLPLSDDRSCPDYAKADYDAIRQALGAVDWTHLLQGDANEQWIAFASVIHQLETLYVPYKNSLRPKKKSPWMTYKAVKLVNKKHKMYKVYKSQTHPAYVKAARQANVEIRRAKRNFEKKLATNIDNDRKSFFAYVRNRSRAKPTVGPLVDEHDGTVLQSQELVEKLNQYFASVFTDEDMSNIPDAKLLFHGNETEKLLDIVVDEDLVRKKLDGLRTDKAAGADGISPRVLVELKDVISFPIMYIINESVRTGVVPDEWKSANVTPIHKKGNKGRVDNYRPISLTSQICKLHESIIRDAIMDHLDKNGLISNTQHGFRKGGSCVSNLIQFFDKVTGLIDADECVDVIYLDFAKAFDKVPHCRLLDKIDKHGIGGRVKEWIRGWLSGRRQRVCVNGHRSSWRSVISGVPQGSVLGPVLFLIFINDLETDIVNSIFKFADDTKLLGKVDNSKDRDYLQQDLQQMMDWSDTWQMPFNTSKCKVMHLGRSNKRYTYFMGSQKLEVVDEEKDLGVHFTADLKPSRQCQQAYSKASKVLGMIGRTITYKSRDILLPLYKTLVRPHLEYCSSVWSPYYSKDKKLLERIQHRYTRMVPGLKQRSYENRLTSLGLWTLEERRNRADLLEVFKTYRGWSTTSFDSLFTLNTGLGTRGHSAKIMKNRCRLDLRRHFFSERVVNRWNSLDQQVMDSTSLNAFKTGLNRIRKNSIGFFTD